MELIINPIWFYGIYVCDSINFFSSLVCILGGVAILLLFIGWCVGYDESEEQKLMNAWKKVFVCVAISFLVSTFVPNKTTIEKMIVANNITPNNIELFGDTVKDGIDYVFEKINSLGEEQ